MDERNFSRILISAFGPIDASNLAHFFQELFSSDSPQIWRCVGVEDVDKRKFFSDRT